MGRQRYGRSWSRCSFCKQDMKVFTTTKENPCSGIYCDDCKVERKEEYELHMKKAAEQAEINRLKHLDAIKEKEDKYYKELEEEEEHYKFLAENEEESYDDWLNSEYGDDAGSAYWNNE